MNDITPARSFDIAIVGPGAAGLVAAMAFAQDGFSVALCGPIVPRGDGRTVALLDQSVRLLTRLGAWPHLEADAAPLEIMRLIDDTDSLFRPPPVSFRASELGLSAFGFNIENGLLVERLAAQALSDPRIVHFAGRVETVTRANGTATLGIEDGAAALTCRLVIGADGYRSVVRQAAGIDARDWSYPQAAVTTTFSHTRDHDNISTEFHTRGGPFTLVPLKGRRSSLVWLMDDVAASDMGALDDAALGRRIERQSRAMLGAVTVDGPRGFLPMRGVKVERYTDDRIALVGEAAHVFPPIGAQGLNLGLRDVAALRDVVVEARARGDDVGALETLLPYESGRRRDVGTRTAAVDALNRSLLTPFLPLDLARGAGLLALDVVGPLRRMVMREGLAPGQADPERLPELMRG